MAAAIRAGPPLPGWFHGSISRTQAQQLLTGQPDGSFLARQSTSHAGAYALDLINGGLFLHLLVEKTNAVGGVRMTPVPEREIMGHEYSSLDALYQSNRAWLLNPIESDPSFDPSEARPSRGINTEGEEEAELLMRRPSVGYGVPPGELGREGEEEAELVMREPALDGGMPT